MSPAEDLLDWLRTGDVRALSIRQPWPHHILHDGKDIENRSWRTRRRGWFLIHAGTCKIEAPEFITRLQLPLGGIVGAARITGCADASSSRWWLGPVGFELADPIEIDLVPCLGRLGFFRLDEAALDEVRGQLERQVRKS